MEGEDYRINDHIYSGKAASQGLHNCLWNEWCYVHVWERD